jgi:hypothetical protein
MSIFENILKLGLILVSYVFYLNCNSPNSSPQFYFDPRISLSQPIPFWQPIFFRPDWLSSTSGQSRCCPTPTATTHRCITTSSSHPSMWETRAFSRAPFPFWNGCCPLLSSPQNGRIEELYSLSTISPPWYHIPTLICTIKGIGILIIHSCIHSPPSFEFLLCKDSFSPQFKSPPPPLLAAQPRLSLCRPELMAGAVLGEPLLLPKHTWRAPMHHNHCAQTSVSSCRRKSTVNRTSVTIYSPYTQSTTFPIQK